MHYKKGTFSLNIVTMIFGILLIYAILIISSPRANATILLDADWENGTFNDYYMNVSRNEYGVKIVDGPTSRAPTCSGTKSLKSELIFQKGTVWSQLVLNMDQFNSFDIGKRHWFAFAIYLPADYVPDTYEEMVWELHGRPDSSDGELSRNAPVALRIDGDHWVVSYIKDSRYITYKAGDAKKMYEESRRINIGKYETGKWTIFVIDTLMDYRPSGYVKIWKDGELVVNKTNGIGFNDKKGPFVRMGLYKAIWDLSKSWGGPTSVSSRTIYMDDFRVGDANTSYAEIAPNCNGSTPPKPRPPTDFQVR